MPALRAALVTPLSGPLARYGRSAAAALALWAREAADLPAPYSAVDLAVSDAWPDTAAAMNRATRMDPHLLFGPYGSGPAIAAAQATSRLIWNHGGASSELRWPAYPHVLNIASPACRYFTGTLELAANLRPAAREVSLLFARTGFGRDVAAGAVATALRLRLALHATSFASGAAYAAARQAPGADVLLVAGRFDDDLAAARALGGRRWLIAALVGAGEQDVLAALGPEREGLVGPAQWLATAATSPDEGPSARWFQRRFEAATGAQPGYPAAQAFAAGVIAARALREAGEPADEALRDAAKTMSCVTMYGAFRLDPRTGLQEGHEVLTVQWQGGRRRVVWPTAEVPLAWPSGGLPRLDADR
jgi:branched-chain amino acid transport system substrate-binding protein